LARAGAEGVIQRWKNRALTPDKVRLPMPGFLLAEKLVEASTATIRKRLKNASMQQSSADLSASQSGRSLPRNPEVLAEKYQDRFSSTSSGLSIKDTMCPSYLWLRLLAQKHRQKHRLCGD